MASWKQSISDIEVHPILRTYYLFKDDFCLESYLININDYVVRKSLSKLRMSSHSLEIENGRHKNPKVPVDQRICNKCVLNVIEDEFHFLVICPKYDNIRKILYDKIHSVCSNFILMSDILIVYISIKIKGALHK